MVELAVRLHPDDFEAIQRAAAAAKMDVADFVSLSAYKISRSIEEKGEPVIPFKSASGVVL